MTVQHDDSSYVIRLPNGLYLKKVHADGSSVGVANVWEALQFHGLEQAEGYVSQYLYRDANCLSIAKVTVNIEIVKQSCIG